MTFLLMLAGALLGAFICGAIFDGSVGLTGALFGMLIGLLIAQLNRLRARVGQLEQGLASLKAAAQTVPQRLPATPKLGGSAAPPAVVDLSDPGTGIEPMAPAPASAAMSQPVRVESDSAVNTVTQGERAVFAVDTPSATPPALPAASIATPRVPPQMRRAPQAPPDGVVLAWIKRWFTQGNVPVKIGVLVLFLGVAALLKYASDEGWLRVPVQFRLVCIVIAALAALVFAWRKRESHRAFALSLQGGAIGVLLLTIFAAFRLYQLLPPGLTFVLLLVVIAGTGVLAVLQDALALALLGIIGGFLAPILVSTGHGNHVALFSYYALLNAAIFVIAWIKPWRALNLVGFAFTFVIGILWGAQKYQPELFASTEPFLLLFFAFYLLIPLFYARRLAPDKRDLIDGSLVFGMPLIAFPLQAALLDGARMPIAYSAIAAATIYAALATLELRRLGLKLLGQSHALLALGFATLAVPIALSARATACTWAIEGAALVWLGLRQQRRLPRWIGYGLQAFAGLAFLGSYGDYDGDTAQDVANIVIFNGQYLGSVLIALAGLITARLLARDSARAPLGVVFLVWGCLWWYTAGLSEIFRFASVDLRADCWLVFIALSCVAAIELYRRLEWRQCAYPATLMFIAGLPFIAGTMAENHGPLEHWAAAAWAVWLLCALRIFAQLRVEEAGLARVLYFIFLWTVSILLGVEFAHLADAHFGLVDIWQTLAGLLPVAITFWLVLARSRVTRWPLDDLSEPLRPALLGSIAALLGLIWLLSLLGEGVPTPLLYVPLLNPLELAQLAYMLLLLAWYRQAEREGTALLDAETRARVLAVAGFFLLTSITLRGTHFLGGVPWTEAWWHSPLAQAALSITWTLAGIAAMLLGKLRGSRAVWFGGAALMGIVLVKLGLVDRQYLHDLPAIIGVLVVGVLLVGVGYFAPVPPRSENSADSRNGESP